MCFVAWNLVADILHGFMLYRSDNYLWSVFCTSNEK